MCFFATFGWWKEYKWGMEYKTLDKDNPDVFETTGYVQAMDGLELWINTVTDEMITVKVNDSELRWYLYCKNVRVTIEVIGD